MSSDKTETEHLIQMARVAQHMKSILEKFGLDVTDEHLIDTPKRVAQMYAEMFSSVGKDPKEQGKLRTRFPNTEEYDQMVLADNIPFSSLCSHHLVPFSGMAWILYIPGEWVAGLSKFTRILQFFAAKPQLQERLTQEVRDFIMEVFEPKGVMIVMRGIHECTRCRGVKNHGGSGMVTSAIAGRFTESIVREEGLQLISLSNQI